MGNFATAQSNEDIPDWIKLNADWWSKGLISDKEFALGLGFMIKERIIQVENVDLDPQGEIIISDNLQIPDWIQNNAKWWADGIITNAEFKTTIQYLLKEEVISFKNKSEKNKSSTTETSSVSIDECPIDNFLDVSNSDGAGLSYPKPYLNVYCDEEFVYVESNGIPHYTFVQTTPIPLSEQDYLWKIPLNPKTASQTSEIPLLDVIGFAVNGLPIYGPNEAERPDPYGDPVYNELLDSCLGHTAGRGDYHYHAFELSCLALNIGNYKESPILGYALDGFPIYGPFGCVDDDCTEIIEFQSSWIRTGDPTTYAWDNHDYVPNSDPIYLDECNGRYDDKLGYHYRATENFPYLLGCYVGELTSSDNQFTEFENNNQGGPPQGGPPQGGPPPPR